MSNMSYCRFRNTAGDLADCQDALERLLNGQRDEDGERETLSREELQAAKQLVATCLNVVELLAESVGEQLENMTEEAMEDAVANANAVATSARDRARARDER